MTLLKSWEWSFNTIDEQSALWSEPDLIVSFIKFFTSRTCRRSSNRSATLGVLTNHALTFLSGFQLDRVKLWEVSLRRNGPRLKSNIVQKTHCVASNMLKKEILMKFVSPRNVWSEIIFWPPISTAIPTLIINAESLWASSSGSNDTKPSNYRKAVKQ